MRSQESGKALRRLRGLMKNLRKWQYQPAGRQTGHSWRSTIQTQLAALADMLQVVYIFYVSPTQWEKVGGIGERSPTARPGRLLQAEQAGSPQASASWAWGCCHLTPSGG